MRNLPRALGVIALLSSLLGAIGAAPASADPVTATGTNPAICNQTVGLNTNVTAVRIAGGDCVVQFKNVGLTSWTTPSAMTNLQVLVVAGGGGGAGRHSGGGGGGGVLHVTSLNLNLNTNYSLFVGAGGAGSIGSTSGSGSAGQQSYFNNSSGTGSLVANGGGGGGGGSYLANQLNYDGTSTNTPYPSRGSGGGSQSDAAGTFGVGAPGSVSGAAKSAGASNVTINGVSATINAYGSSGALGRSSGFCNGPGGVTGWCGGGGGGSGETGKIPTQPGGVNPWQAGNGGAGVALTISGTSTQYAGGGGGGAGYDVNTTNANCLTNSPTGSTGGAGGGGAGGRCVNDATSGTANTGGGGGGGGLGYIGTGVETGKGGTGGSGLIVIRYTPDSTAPSLTNGTTFLIDENSATTVNAATITTNESSTITINSGSDVALFIAVYSDSLTARIRFIASPNFESPTDGGANSVYNVSIRATDTAGNYADQSIAITVRDVNEAPTIGSYSSAATATYTSPENTSSLFDLTGTDVDTGTVLTYSLTGTDASFFSVNSGGTLRFVSAPDYEGAQDAGLNNGYIVIAWVSDGTLSDSQTITINVTNINEASSIGSIAMVGTAYKGLSSAISVSVNAPGKVRFFFKGKKIATCLSIATSGTYPNYSATCNWKPAVRGAQNVSALFTPTDNTFTSSTATGSIFVLTRQNKR